MKITLKNTPEQVELVQAMASRDRAVAFEAQQAFAEFMGKLMAEVMQQAPILANFYTDMPFAANTTPSIPLDLYADVTDMDYLSVWSQTQAGGLGTNEVKPPSQEMYIPTYGIDSAISFDKKHAAQSRLDVVSKSMTRLMQEILFKQENFAVGPLMSALASASTNGKSHVFRTGVSGRFVMQDLNDLLTLMKRINTSFIKGTPAGNVGSITDILFSPEAAQELRGMAYNAINTKTAPISAAIKDAVPAPEAIRQQLFESTGVPNFFGISFHEFNEFGVNQRFNTVFDVAAGSTAYTDISGGNSATFDGTASQVMVGIDRNKDSLLRPVATDSETSSTFVLEADSQFQLFNRTNKIGYFDGMQEGRVILDIRALAALIL